MQWVTVCPARSPLGSESHQVTMSIPWDGLEAAELGAGQKLWNGSTCWHTEGQTRHFPLMCITEKMFCVAVTINYSARWCLLLWVFQFLGFFPQDSPGKGMCMCWSPWQFTWQCPRGKAENEKISECLLHTFPTQDNLSQCNWSLRNRETKGKVCWVTSRESNFNKV